MLGSKRSKKIILLMITLLISFSLAACSDSGKETSKTGKKTLRKVSVRLQWLPMAQFAGIYVAKSKGFYKDAGLDVEILPGGPDFNAVTLVAQGAQDFGVWTADGVLLARSNGVPVVGIAAIVRKSPLGYMVMADSDIYGPKDFVGKKIGMVYGRDVETAYVEMLHNAGVERKKIIEIPEKFDMQLFYRGDYDIYSVYIYDQPYTARKDGYKVRIIRPSDYGVEFYADTLITSDALIKKDPALVESFVTATLKGWNYALAHPDEAVDIVLKVEPTLTRASQEFQIKILSELIRHENPDKIGWFNMKTVEKLKQEHLRQGLLKKDLDIKSVFTNRFIK